MANLDRELEGSRAAAGTNAARYQVIEDCRWPSGARIAVNVTADFDAMLLRRLLNEPALRLAKGEFGGRVGIWRLLELFASHDIKATIFTPGRVCELYPDAVRAIAANGHEVADHMWEHRVPAEGVLEEEHLKRVLDALEKLAGKRPVGTRSGHTLSVLRAEGIIYHSNRVQDHRAVSVLVFAALQQSVSAISSGRCCGSAQAPQCRDKKNMSKEPEQKELQKLKN